MHPWNACDSTAGQGDNVDELSRHAARRAAQRGITPSAADATVRWGLPIRQRGGRTAYFLGKRQVAAAAASGEDVSCFEGTVAVLSRDGSVVTLIRAVSPRRLRRRAAEGF